MATAVLVSKSREANFQRIARLLIVGGTTLLREFFDIRCPPSFLPEILQNPGTVKRLKEANLTERQWDCLYPTPGVYGKSTDFDISLLIKLLQTICNIAPPDTGWNVQPKKTDQSLGADLARVHYCRDFVYSHVSENAFEITDDEVTPICGEISDSFMRIAAQISPEKELGWQNVIHKFLNDPLVVEEEKSVKELLEWYENDIQVMKELISIVIPSQDLSLQTALQGNAQRFKDLLREELKSKTQSVEEGVERGLEETALDVPVKKDLPIKNEPEEVCLSEEGPTSSVVDIPSPQAAGALLRLYIDCEIISGPALQSGSSEKNAALQKRNEDLQRPMVKSVPTGIIKEDHDIKELLQSEEEQNINEGILKGVKRLSLKSFQQGLEETAHMPQSAIQDKNQDTKDQIHCEQKAVPQTGQQEIEHLNLKGVHIGENQRRARLSLRFEAQEVLTKTPPGSSEETAGKAQGDTIPHIPTEQQVLNLIANKYLTVNDPSSPEELNAFVEYLGRVRKLLIVDTKVGSLIITVQCGSLEILDELWKDYNTGHINEVVQKCLVTDDILEEFGEVKLTITIPEEDYKAGREYFLRVSSASKALSRIGKRKKPAPTLHSVDSKKMKMIEFAVKDGSPTDHELKDLSPELAEKWKQLGRLLKFEESMLRAISAENDILFDKAYRMLTHWKQRDGSKATYQVLSDALRHKLVKGHDLADKFCYQIPTPGASEESMQKLALHGAWMDTKTESKVTFEVSDKWPKTEGEVKIEASSLELSATPENKMKTVLSDKELDTKTKIKVIKIEPSDVELSATPDLENKMETELSDEGLDKNTETNVKVELPGEAMDTESENKLAFDTSGERLDALSDNSIITMPNADSERCKISKEGAVWKLQDIQAAAYITFSQNSVSEAVLFKCTRKEPVTHSPPLKKDEILVSNIIELSYVDTPTSSFTGDFCENVLVTMSHSAANLKGYEVVIKELVDADNGDWRDLETTNIWQGSEIQGDLLSKPTLPFSEAQVTCCSTFAVVCRLKSYTYSSHAMGNSAFTCIVDEYPDVSVAIPASAIHANKEFQLTLKVQEIPHQWFEESELIVGPVLHITCSHNFELLEPATISIPITLQADKREFSEISSSNVKVLTNLDEETSDWKEITDQLPSPADLTNGVVTFQVTHFSKWHVVYRVRKRKGLRRMKKLSLGWLKPSIDLVREAGFFACLCDTGSRKADQFLLKMCCYPIHMKSLVKREIHSEHRVLLHDDANSLAPLCENDEIRVTLKGLKASLRALRVRFLGVENFKASATVGRDPRCDVPEIDFTKHIRGQGTICLCSLSLGLPLMPTTTQNQTDTVKDDTPTRRELFDLSQKLDVWKPLGRQLEIDDSKLTKFEREHPDWEEQAYHMLSHWKQRDGSNATYRVLYNALCNVDRKDLGEEFCLVGKSLT